MLEDLWAGRLQGHENIFIEDVVEAPGRPLVMAMLYNMCQRYDRVILLASERPHWFFTEHLPAPLKEKVQVPAIPRGEIGKRLPVGPLISSVLSEIQGSGMSYGVVFTSVTLLICTHRATAVPQLIHSLLSYEQNGSKVKQVVTLLHSDCHDESVCRIVRGHPDMLIRLQPPSSPKHGFCCSLYHGEAVYHQSAESVEQFNISEGFTGLQDVIKSHFETVKKDSNDSQIDPAANLTFNLSLKAEEKAAKDQVVLPYTRMQGSSSDSQSGLIHYVPDEDDDFDDEDPDEDLEF